MITKDQQLTSSCAPLAHHSTGRELSRVLTGARCKCGGCGELFNSVTAFDMHRTGRYQPMERRCLSPDEMRSRGMTKNATGFWITETRNQREDRRASRGRARRSGDRVRPAAEVLP